MPHSSPTQLPEYPPFIEDGAFTRMDSSRSENEQLKAMLNNLKRIHLLTAENFDCFDALIRRYISVGIEIFGLETGIVSQISDDLVYTICDVVSPISLLEKGMTFELEGTYCHEVFKSEQTLGFPEVGKLEYMRCHPVYENLKLEAYLSAPIYTEGTLFGTFNFTSTHPRKNGFSEHERDLIQLMANSIGAYIHLRRKEDALVKLNKRIRGLVGYVAHDLRNPIGSIISLCKIALNPNTSDERKSLMLNTMLTSAESALEFVSTILENAALHSGKIEMQLDHHNAQELIDESLKNIDQFTQDNHVAFETEGLHNLGIFCDKKRVHQALINLLLNAVKYSPSSSTILISGLSNDSGIRITIKNPIDSSQGKSVNHSTYGSVGFGIDIVRDIMQSHGGKLNTEIKEGSYFATCQFNHAP